MRRGMACKVMQSCCWRAAAPGALTDAPQICKSRFDGRRRRRRRRTRSRSGSTSSATRTSSTTRRCPRSSRRSARAVRRRAEFKNLYVRVCDRCDTGPLKPAVDFRPAQDRSSAASTVVQCSSLNTPLSSVVSVQRPGVDARGAQRAAGVEQPV